MVLQNAVWCLSIKWIYISSLQKAILSFLSWESIVIPLAIFLVQSSHLIKYSRWLLHRRLPKYHRKTATKPNLFQVQRKVNSLYINTSVQCHSVLSNSLGPHGLQHIRLSCPSLIPGAYSNSFHWVGDAIQPSHPMSSPSPPVFNLSQHQGIFQWFSSSYQVTKRLEFQLQHQSFQWIFRTYFL